MLKGINDGVLIDIVNIDRDIIDLKNKLKNEGFFGQDVDFILKDKDKEYFPELWNILKEYNHNLYVMKNLEEKKEKVLKSIINEENTKVIRKTLRSGQKVEFDGNIVVIGDINPGAIVEASGDVYVFGRARGVLHAGIYGDRSKVILALSMEVHQLRIADVIAKGSDEKPEGRVSEKAYLDSGNLIVEEYKWI